ncbi:MAG TPA: S1/P1 nuclease [Magnetospirillaceae bacterium]|nr:S1/P1 nuclease [Magnetospirillaceae bacterium]
MNKRPLLLIAALAALSVTRPAGAWGVEGHEVVATIAYGLLSDQAKSAADSLLADDPVPSHCGAGSFAFASIWPDRLREDPKQCASANKWGDTESWHFINIPLAANSYDPARDCPGEACVTAKIATFSKILGDKKADISKRRDALKFVIHFVGDLHQPLHTTAGPLDATRAAKAKTAGGKEEADCLKKKYPNDRGGNCLDVRVDGSAGNLHAFWDDDIVSALSPDADAAAEMLIRNTPATGPIAAGTPVDWTNQSHRLAVKIAYGMLPPGPMPELTGGDGSYEAKVEPTAAGQLQAAGIRLAAILEPLLK